MTASLRPLIRGVKRLSESAMPGAVAMRFQASDGRMSGRRRSPDMASIGDLLSPALIVVAGVLWIVDWHEKRGGR